MIKAKLKKKFYNKDLDYITDKTERFIVLMNDFKQTMGAWYTVIALRILAVILFLVPVNVILAHFNLYLAQHYIPDFNWDGPILMVMWGFAMVILILLAILAPKAATVFEFVFGTAYLVFVLKNHLYNSALGVTLLITMTLFLLVKLFFLVVEIMAKVKSSKDAPNVERDETGRIVRKTEGDVLFIKNDDRFEKTDDVLTQGAKARMEYDSDFFFDKVDDTPDTAAKAAYDDDFFFTKEDKKEKNIGLAGSDDDYVF
ncbi:MAG: hypothetical protein K6F88_06305 [Ruminococcus sp.]|nr:hypothetical protein [Ruminococcus sp.]